MLSAACVLVLPLVVASQSLPVQDPIELPPAIATRTPKIDVKHIALDLQFDWDKKQAFGTATLTISPLQATSTIALDAAEMSIEAVVDGQNRPLKFEYAGGDGDENLRIDLGSSLAAGSDVTLHVRYRTRYVNESDPSSLGGSFGKGLRFIKPGPTSPTRRKQVWSNGEPQGNRFVFPCHDDLTDLRTTTVRLTVENGLVGLANGDLVKYADSTNGARTFEYSMATPYQNHLTAIVVGNYAVVDQSSGQTKMQTFGYPDEKQATKDSAARLPDMVKFLTETTGQDYPFGTYKQVVVQDYPFPGLTAPTGLSVLSENFVDDYRTHAEWFYLWDGVEIQALANQWFGSMVMGKGWEDMWLIGGLSRYMDNLFSEKMNGHDEMMVYNVAFDQVSVVGDWTGGYRRPMATKNIEDLGVLVNDNYTRLRGAAVLRLLELEIGRPAVISAIRSFLTAHKGKLVTTNDFKVACEKASKRDLGWFFDQWVTKMGMPEFTVTKRWDKAAKQLTVTIAQDQVHDKGSGYPQVEYFQGNVSLELDGVVKTVALKPRKLNQFTFDLAQAPKFVHFDQDSVWLKQVKYARPVNEMLAELKGSKDALGRQAVIQELVRIASDKETDAATKAAIRDGVRQLVASDAYWRLRFNAIGSLRALDPAPYTPETTALFARLTKDKAAWVRAGSITSLGLTGKPEHAAIYRAALADESDRVINAAAIALGRTKAPGVYETLVELAEKPSWKSQSLISALNGMKFLGDPRGVDFALNAMNDLNRPRWFLGVTTWDYPVSAADTLMGLGRGSLATQTVQSRVDAALSGGDIYDVFSQVLLLAMMGDPKAEPVFAKLRNHYKGNDAALTAVQMYEDQWKAAKGG